MMRVNSNRSIFLNNIYNSIDSCKKKYGELKKCELHIHTPESKCYRFKPPSGVVNGELEGRYLYKELSLEEVLDYSNEIGYLSDAVYKELIGNLEYYKSKEYILKLKEDKTPYGSLKEYIAYMTIAYKLYEENIEVAVVSDHNTIAGYEKLKYSLEKYCKEKYGTYKNSITLFLGVEISCSDKNHLMVIYDEKKLSNLQKYLNEILLDEDSGSYYDTRKIVEDMKNERAITYISHINTSNLLGNSAYKKKLFNSDGLNGIGVTNIDRVDREKARVKEFRKDISDLAIVYEGDSHSITEIGIKNTWIKLSNYRFNSLRKAFLNHQVCIYIKKPLPANKYIKGLVVERGERGFLGKSPESGLNEKDSLAINFSRDLNCIIGGRGSGKSTILNIIETIYSMECDSLDTLTYISQHKRIYSIFTISGREYLLEFIPQVISKGEYNDNRRVFRGSYSEKGSSYTLTLNWYNVFEIIYENAQREFIEIDSKEIPDLLKGVFRRGYNINKLVDKINNKQISSYIKNVITYNVKYTEINNYTRRVLEASNTKLLKIIRENLYGIISMIDTRRLAFSELISEFNTLNEKVLRIDYEPLNSIDEYFDEFIRIFEVDKFGKFSERELRKNVNDTYLTWGDVQDYFFKLVELKNYFEILDLFLNKKFHTIDRLLPIRNFQSLPVSYTAVERELIEINSENIDKVYKCIFDKIQLNKDILRSSIIKTFDVMDNFNIKFNINFKEDVVNNSVNFKDINHLSLGQKVVALLTFVFNFGSITGDDTPLIIDQPEDNLDNVYIYRTLVSSLKKIKNSRQVIIVTHSSTIVTNADAEEVVVMKSNGSIAWIEKNGYPSEDVVTRHIMNYLEGGSSSFNHKKKMYKVILDN